VLATVTLPGGHEPTAITFLSPVHGYSATILDGQIPIRTAAQRWPAGQAWTGGNAMHVDVLDAGLTATSTVLPEGMTAEAWLAEVAPTRRREDRCLSRDGNGSALSEAGRWLPRALDGEPGFLRVECGYLDEVAFVGDRVYFFTLRGPWAPLRQDDEVSRQRFEEFLERVRLPDRAP
jgi:hypothetical protein